MGKGPSPSRRSQGKERRFQVNVADLIAELSLQQQDARVYVRTTTAEFGLPVLQEVEEINPALSPTFGHAVIIELENDHG